MSLRTLYQSHSLRVVWYYKWIAAMIVMASVQLMLVIGVENVLLPVITKREFGDASVYAASAALFSVGGVQRYPQFSPQVC